MKFYFASTPTDFKFVKGKNVLVSYYYILQMKEKFIWSNLKEKFGFKNVFIDSGAFTAYTQKIRIHPHNYAFYLKNSKWIDYYSNLDSIGNAEETCVNQAEIEGYCGGSILKPLPVFHFGENETYLKFYCDNYDYICLGGLVPYSSQPKSIIKWLRPIFEKYPQKKFHGFGISNPYILKMFPWQSCDSSSFLMGGKTGCINTIKYGYISLGRDNTSPSHINNKSLEIKKFIQSKCEEYNIDYNLMVNPSYLLEGSCLRNLFNVQIFQDFVNQINEERGFKEEVIKEHPPLQEIDFEVYEEEYMDDDKGEILDREEITEEDILEEEIERKPQEIQKTLF